MPIIIVMKFWCYSNAKYSYNGIKAFKLEALLLEKDFTYVTIHDGSDKYNYNLFKRNEKKLFVLSSLKWSRLLAC